PCEAVVGRFTGLLPGYRHIEIGVVLPGREADDGHDLLVRHPHLDPVVPGAPDRAGGPEEQAGDYDHDHQQEQCGDPPWAEESPPRGTRSRHWGLARERRVMPGLSGPTDGYDPTGMIRRAIVARRPVRSSASVFAPARN